MEFHIFSYVMYFSTESSNDVLNCEQMSVRLSLKLHGKVIQVGLQRLNLLKSKIEFSRGIGLDDLQMSLLIATTLRNKTTNLKGKLVYAKARVRFLNFVVTHLSVAQ